MIKILFFKERFCFLLHVIHCWILIRRIEHYTEKISDRNPPNKYISGLCTYWSNIIVSFLSSEIYTMTPSWEFSYTIILDAIFFRFVRQITGPLNFISSFVLVHFMATLRLLMNGRFASRMDESILHYFLLSAALPTSRKIMSPDRTQQN